ncbi:hypothetical protein HU200_065162 [Digitaria exilis]|uniref:Fatty acyl-CoA reductase n=1 Tax=Digitaria exilis TaxID=1010633 RepID=A0A834ZZ07_9POAL|nr:hypothetical protein HU200_065162 [Digitaria exilis]
MSTVSAKKRREHLAGHVDVVVVDLSIARGKPSPFMARTSPFFDGLTVKLRAVFAKRITASHALSPLRASAGKTTPSIMGMLLISGGGRCNVIPASVDSTDPRGPSGEVIVGPLVRDLLGSWCWTHCLAPFKGGSDLRLPRPSPVGFGLPMPSNGMGLGSENQARKIFGPARAPQPELAHGWASASLFFIDIRAFYYVYFLYGSTESTSRWIIIVIKKQFPRRLGLPLEANLDHSHKSFGYGEDCAAHHQLPTLNRSPSLVVNSLPDCLLSRQLQPHTSGPACLSANSLCNMTPMQTQTCHRADMQQLGISMAGISSSLSLASCPVSLSLSLPPSYTHTTQTKKMVGTMEETRIPGYFKNKGILVTGSTGFLGKILVEKILRVQPDVKRIYLPVRAPDAESAKKRVETEVSQRHLQHSQLELVGSYCVQSRVQCNANLPAVMRIMPTGHRYACMPGKGNDVLRPPVSRRLCKPGRNILQM